MVRHPATGELPNRYRRRAGRGRPNLVHDNTGDGIEVQATNARLRDNSATVNGDFGIDAAAGVTDLGGNFASGNGNPLQCRNVFCS
jgi:hypothetical protein